MSTSEETIPFHIDRFDSCDLCKDHILTNYFLGPTSEYVLHDFGVHLRKGDRWLHDITQIPEDFRVEQHPFEFERDPHTNRRTNLLIVPANFRPLVLELRQIIDFKDFGRQSKEVFWDQYGGPFKGRTARFPFVIKLLFIEVGGRAADREGHDYRVSLIGKQATDDYWISFLPPQYRDASIDDCESWVRSAPPGSLIIDS